MAIDPEGVKYHQANAPQVFNPFRVVAVLGRLSPRALPSVEISIPFGDDSDQLRRMSSWF